MGKNGISSTRSVFFCGQIAILFHEINFPGPKLNALHTCKPSCVNSKWCRLLKLAILSISRVEFCSWTMHTDAVVPLTCLSFNAVYMFLAETTPWPSLQYLRLMLLTETESCHPYLFQPVAQNDRTSRVRFLSDVRALVRMTLAYFCDNNVLIWS